MTSSTRRSTRSGSTSPRPLSAPRTSCESSCPGSCLDSSSTTKRCALFHRYGIEDEIAKIQRRHVPLPEGGSIVIDQTEALVAIDVNSGNFRVEDDAERTAYEMNLRAAKEIARQLRLRDLGGVIVNDFIDMREERHSRGVERVLREAISRDRARTKIPHG